MECPICGEQVPLNAEECPLCGSPVDQFFLTEEAESSSLKMAVDLPYIPRRSLALEPILTTRVLITAGVSACVILAGVVLLLAFVTGSKSKTTDPRQAIRNYYNALSQRDYGAAVATFDANNRPSVLESGAVEDDIKNNTYSVSGLTTRVAKNDGKKATAVLESVQVTKTGRKGRTSYDLVTDVVKPLQEQDPNQLVLVDLLREGSSWKIADRPLHGWAPENLWVVGHAGTP